MNLRIGICLTLAALVGCEERERRLGILSISDGEYGDVTAPESVSAGVPFRLEFITFSSPGSAVIRVIGYDLPGDSTAVITRSVLVE